ncbi:ComF family protein [Terrisporobacter petrolearius]|uniref:ComF family protein n=1 Tax=Terrisporobacter petrolearius TaxID=1460447 RepID=UPI0031CC5FEF
MKRISKLIPNNIKETIKIAINYVYPRNITCIICDNPIKLKNPYSLCRSCFKELRFILDGCNKCGKPIVNRNLERESLIECNYCYNKIFYFDKAIACIEYDDISKKLILDFKYKSKTYLCRYVAYLMKEKILLEDIKADYILFVPLHKKRLKKRGFNQAEKIANKLSDLINIPVLDCISREKNTKKLYKLNKEDREKELKNGFKVKNNINLIKNKNVILIDDIFTTGSTANEISKVLKINAANNICIFTLLTTCVDVYVKE